MLTSMVFAVLAALCLAFRANYRNQDHTGVLDDGSDTDRGDHAEVDDTTGITQNAVQEPIALDYLVSASESQYFGEHVNGLDFEHMWEKLRQRVPLTRLQSFQHADDKISWPVCHPTLVGPRNSEKLAILLHGFLSCPGMWFRVVPLLVDAGFRVMLPTLPGHGRNPRSSKDHGDGNGSVSTTAVNLSNSDDESDAEGYWSDDDEYDMSDLETNGASLLETRGYAFEDDITEIPTSALGYIEFAYALQRIAAQFKKEHPNGLIVAAGHSLGGAITAKYAMEIPEVVDRVLLLNPMLGLAWSWVETGARMLPGTLFSKGSKCEKQRGRSSGGICQFRLGHVNAMSQFAYAVLCCHWGLEAKCQQNISFFFPALFSSYGAPISMAVYEAQRRFSMCQGTFGLGTDGKVREGFGKMRGFQVVSTKGEALVDNGQIKLFAHIVGEYRKRRPHGYTSKIKADFCLWPSDLSHSYMSNRKKDDIPEKWWHPYVESVVAEFLSRGQQIDIVRVGRRGAENDCLVRSHDVAGRALAVLPAIQHSGPAAKYWLAGEDIRWVIPVHILFSGGVQKQSSFFGTMRARRIELLRHRKKLLIVTRLAPNDNIRDIFLVGDAPASLTREFLTRAGYAEGTRCVKLDMYHVRKNRPLRQELDAVRNGYGRGGLSLKFCGKSFVDKLCEVSACQSDDESSVDENYHAQPLN